MGMGIRTSLPAPLDMLIRGGIRGNKPPITTTTPPPISAGPQTPITPTQSPNDSVPDENGIPRFADGLIDFAKAMAPTLAGAGLGAVLGGGEGALLGAQAGSSFQRGVVEQDAKVEQDRIDNQISAFGAQTDRLKAETAAQKANAKTGSVPKYFQNGNVVLRVNPDGTQEKLTIGGQKGQFIQVGDKVLYGNGDGTLIEAYQAPQTTVEVDPKTVSKYNQEIATINDQLVKGTYDIDQALTQAKFQASANGIEWNDVTENSLRKTFERFQVPERKRAFKQLSSGMQTEILKAETFIDAIDAVDVMLDNPTVEENIGLVPGTLTELTARVNTEGLEPELQRFYSELKNAFDLLVRNRTGAALSMGEEQFYNTLFGSVKGGKDNLLQSIDVQRQSALGTIENAFALGPITYVEQDPSRLTNLTLKQMILADPEGVPDSFIDEMDRRLNRGLILQ